MHINKILFFSIFLLTSQMAYSQFQAGDIVVRTDGFIRELKAAPATVKGSNYLNDTWEEYIIELDDNTYIESNKVKFDLDNNIFEIVYFDEIKVLPGYRVKKFTRIVLNEDVTLDSLNYTHQRELGDFAGQLTEFVQVLYQGKSAVVVESYLEIIPPSYNLAMNVGEKAEKIIKKERVSAIVDKKVIPIEGNNKKNLAMFGDKKEVMANYVKKHKLSFKDRNELVLIFSHYDSLP